MESEAPDVPSLSLPLTGRKVESPTRFDWGGVSDDSLPVTYTLQVATSEDFYSASMVLEKAELTSSEYTLSESEELEPRSTGHLMRAPGQERGRFMSVLLPGP